MGSRQPALFDSLLHKRQGKRVEWEYPFAAAGLNITHHLAQLLGLQQPGTVPSSGAARGFLGLLQVRMGAGCQELPSLKATGRSMRSARPPLCPPPNPPPLPPPAGPRACL
jgi:hypothetical protein